MSNLLRTFLKEPKPPTISKGEGMWLFLNDGKKYFDMTAGFTAHAVIGWNNKIVNQEISNQLKKITELFW